MEAPTSYAILFLSFVLMITIDKAPKIGRHFLSSAKDVMDHYRRTPRKVITTVETMYLPPSDDAGSRFTATTCDSKQFDFVHMDYALTTSENHLAAAMGVISSQLYGNYSLISFESVRDSAAYLFTFQAEEW